MPPGHVRRPNGMDSYLLMHFHDPVEIESDGRVAKYPANTFVVWKPGDPHYFGSSGRLWRHSWLHCYGASVPSSLQGSGLIFGVPVLLPHAATVDFYLPQTYRELTSYVKPDVVTLECLVTLWLREVRRLTSKADGQRFPENFILVRHHIESRMAERLRMEDLATLAGLSVSHFITRFRQHFGVSPLQYQLDLRMRYAAHLLQDRHLTVAQVAQAVGFEDPFYFSRQFRIKCGESPRHYRRNI